MLQKGFVYDMQLSIYMTTTNLILASQVMLLTVLLCVDLFI